MTDEKEREVARKLRYFELGGDYKCVQFRRSIGTDGQRILWAIVDTVPRWRDRGIRWSVHWWNIDTDRQGWYDRRTLERCAEAPEFTHPALTPVSGILPLRASCARIPPPDLFLVERRRGLNVRTGMR